MTLSISNVAALAACNAIVDLCDTGSTDAQASITIYSGSVPANVDTALAGNTVLAELEMSNPSFGAAADAAPGAIATAASITDDTAADATGTASFFRIFNRDNVAVIQGTCGTSGTDMIMNSTSITSGSAVQITSLTVTMREA